MIRTFDVLFRYYFDSNEVSTTLLLALLCVLLTACRPAILRLEHFFRAEPGKILLERET